MISGVHVNREDCNQLPGSNNRHLDSIQFKKALFIPKGKLIVAVVVIPFSNGTHLQ